MVRVENRKERRGAVRVRGLSICALTGVCRVGRARRSAPTAELPEPLPLTSPGPAWLARSTLVRVKARRNIHPALPPGWTELSPGAVAGERVWDRGCVGVPIAGEGRTRVRAVGLCSNSNAHQLPSVRHSTNQQPGHPPPRPAWTTHFRLDSSRVVYGLLLRHYHPFG